MLERWLKPKTSHMVGISPTAIIFATFFLGLLYFLYQIRSIIILLFVAFIVMVALNPAVTKLEKRLKFHRAIAIAIVYITFLTVLITGGALIIPPLVTELYSLLRTLNLPVLNTLQQELVDIRLTVTDISNLVDQFGSSIAVVVGAITSTFTVLFTFFTLLVISFYLLLDRPHLYKKMHWFSKDEKTIHKARDLIDSIELQLGGWVRAQVVLMIVVGLITYIGLTLIGVPYALPLAILAGLLEVLPNLGPTLASLPAIGLAFLTLNPVMGVITMIFYVLVQQLENNLLVPRVMKDNADVNPLVAIVTILIGLKLAGFGGALLAVPAYIILRTLYATWYRSQRSI